MLYFGEIFKRFAHLITFVAYHREQFIEGGKRVLVCLLSILNPPFGAEGQDTLYLLLDLILGVHSNPIWRGFALRVAGASFRLAVG